MDKKDYPHSSKNKLDKSVDKEGDEVDTFSDSNSSSNSDDSSSVKNNEIEDDDNSLNPFFRAMKIPK